MEYGLVLLWLLALHALALAGWPLAGLLFVRPSDRGAGFALPVALVVVTVVAYWVGRLAFGWPALAAGLAVLLAGSGLAWRRGVRPPLRRYGEVAVVFTLAFLLLVAVRAADPAVMPLGGEKFLDFGLLQSLHRAETLPPQDVWFAGEPVQYYYGGHLVAALLTRLTGTAPRYAYNLALAGVYATLVTAAYGLAGSVAERRGLSRPLAGGFAVFLVGVASNLSTPARLVYWLLPEWAAAPMVEHAAFEAKGLAQGPDAFSYWTASRVVDGTINEFPLFAFLNGDLHAHMVSTPFLLLVAGVLFEYARTPDEAVTRRRALVVGAVPVVAGLLAVVNTWSFPTAVGLTWLALALSPSTPTSLLPAVARRRLPAADGRLGREVERIAVATGLAALVGVVAALWVLPFLLGAASGRSVAFFPDRSSLGELLLVHGAFLAVFAAYLARRLPVGGRTTGRFAALAGAALLLAWLGGASAVALFGLPLAVGWALLRGVGASGDAAATGDRAATDGDGSGDGFETVPGVGFETVLLVAGAGLALLVEFAYVSEQAGPERLNTVFKTYMQVWVLWGTAAAVMLAELASPPAATELASSSRSVARSRLPSRGGRATTLLAVALVASLSLYAGFALADHFEGDDEATLDATRFVDRQHAEEAAAIAWLNDREGQPHIVTAPSSNRCYMYQWGTTECGDDVVVSGGNAPASLTGVPTVAGWAHEVGYRGEAPYRERVADVNAIYTGTDAERARLLAAYDVEYVYVGPAERDRYGAVDLSTVEGVTVEHRSGDVVVYGVDRSELENER